MLWVVIKHPFRILAIFLDAVNTKEMRQTKYEKVYRDLRIPERPILRWLLKQTLCRFTGHLKGKQYYQSSCRIIFKKECMRCGGK